MVRGVPRHTKCGGGAQSSVVADESNQSTLDLCAPRDWVGVPGARRVGCSKISQPSPPLLHASLSLVPLCVAAVRRSPCSGLADSTRTQRPALPTGRGEY